MTEVTAIVARDFRGVTLYLKNCILKDAHGASQFSWTDNRSHAVRLSPAAAIEIAELAAREWKADAYAIDTAGNILRPANSRPESEPAPLTIILPEFTRFEIEAAQAALNGYPDDSPFWESSAGQEHLQVIRALHLKRAEGAIPYALDTKARLTDDTDGDFPLADSDWSEES